MAMKRTTRTQSNSNKQLFFDSGGEDSSGQEYGSLQEMWDSVLHHNKRKKTMPEEGHRQTVRCCNCQSQTETTSPHRLSRVLSTAL